MDNQMDNQMDNIIMERYALMMERIYEIPKECAEASDIAKETAQYFTTVSNFLILLEDVGSFFSAGDLIPGACSPAASTAPASIPLAELAERNHALYAELQPEAYETSFLNPTFAVKQFGEDFGRMLSFLYREMRSLIPFVFENRMEEIVIRLELFVEVYSAFTGAWREKEEMQPETLRQILYWFVSDYTEIAATQHLKEMLVPEDNFAINIIKNADLTNERYLYAYGEYISENELETARFLAGLPEEIIHTMADTYTEGYRIGFEVTGKDLSKKKYVEIRYHLGFERMMRRAVENFERMGLQVTCYRAPSSILYNPSIFKVGYCGGEVNRQYDFDHKDDKALFWDKVYKAHKLEVTRTAFEKYKSEALLYAGPAVVETFGERDFAPVNKPEALKLSDEQNKLLVEYRSMAGALQREYILEEERSFTIIAFPVPEMKEAFDEGLVKRLGKKDADECFRDFFREVIRINTLDYTKYRQIQQCLIDALDKADCCVIKGMNGNRTDLTVNLWKLQDPEKETIFENCVADVNIPVGEVFTSPVLAGTNGLLHVNRVYLNGLEYKNLELRFEDGKIVDYNCSNFATEEENRSFVKENVLFKHKTLPMGEFAIGTNTVAYVVANRYGVQDKLPILIAEKTGPHFAVGDTCYSHAEDTAVFNPDGKEIVARDNEIARLRDKAPDKAYFNCHTDVTIPYDELGSLIAVHFDGTEVPVIQNGRFVLPGTEELNEAFAE